jgi:hypothetical protein
VRPATTVLPALMVVITLLGGQQESAILSSVQARNGRIEAELQQVVHGVVISRRSIGVDAWLQAPAQDIPRAADRDTAAREALERLLHG